MNRPQVKKLLLIALNSAILWEESCIDAGTHMGNRKLLREMQKNIQHFTEMMNEIAPNRGQTLREYLISLPSESFATVDALMNTQSKGGSE